MFLPVLDCLVRHIIDCDAYLLYKSVILITVNVTSYGRHSHIQFIVELRLKIRPEEPIEENLVMNS